MKLSRYSSSFLILALLILSVSTAMAQTEQESGEKKASSVPAKKGQKVLDQAMMKMEMSDRQQEPHQVMALAYLQSLGTFAKALGDQAAMDNPLSADFARAAVDEINRSLDRAKEHHLEHMKTIKPEMRARMTVMAKEMEAQHNRLNAAVDALEKDVQNYTLDTRQIAADSATILKQLEEMIRMHSAK